MKTGFLSRFRRDKRGAIAVLIAVAIIPLIGMIGLATDAARGFMARSRLSSAVDAAALAAGQVFFQDRRVTDARQYFDANFPPGYMGSTITKWVVHPDATEPVTTADKVFSVRASATIPTTFMRIFGKQTMTVSAYAEVTRESRPLDVVLAFDMSGSMLSNLNGETRLQRAKDAAMILLSSLYGSSTENALLKVGVVPWAGAVNVTINGTHFGYDSNGNQLPDSERVHDEYVTAFFNQHASYAPNPKDPYKTHKAINAQTYQADLYYAHNSPVPLLSNPVFKPETSSPKQVWSGCVWARWDISLPASKTAHLIRGVTAEWPGWEPMGAETLVVPGSGKNYRCPADLYSPRNDECTPCPLNGITPLTKSRTAVEAAIEDPTIGLKIPAGYGSGFDRVDSYTNLPTGLAWAWRVVSPEPPFTEGADFQPGYEPMRAIVLLTDGENTCRAGDAYNGEIGNTVSQCRTHRDEWLREIAAAAKGEGIEIYTIQFANANSSTATLLKEVATQPNAPYYFNAPTETELNAAFKEIANHLSNLRLSK